MAAYVDLKGEIQLLTTEIERNSDNIEARIGRAKLYYKCGMFALAANDFTKVLELQPTNIEADEYLVMIDEIQSYRYTDLLNP